MEANKEEREKIKKACQERRIVIDPPIQEAIDRMFNKPKGEPFDFTITQYKLKCWGPWSKIAKDGKTQLGNQGGFGIDWQSKSAGTGRVDFVKDLETGKIECDSECCNKQFVKDLLCKMIDNIDWTENEWDKI